jgi:hypothetical protein
MDIMAIFITDPIVKRVRRMNAIQKEIISITAKKHKLETDALKITEEYEKLRLETKNLKKNGSSSV